MIRKKLFPGHFIATLAFVCSIYAPVLQTHGSGFSADELPFAGTSPPDKFLGL